MKEKYDIIPKHPLYPHKLALEYCSKQSIEYKPVANSIDFRYNRFYENALKDVVEGKAPPRDIWHFVTSIKRYRDPIEGEKVTYREIIQTYDRNMIPWSFEHEVGMFEINEIQPYYDYDNKQPAKRFTGVVERHYYLDYSEKLIRDLMRLKPDRGRQVFYVIDEAYKKHTNTIYFTSEAFARLSYYELYEIAASKIVPDTLRDKVRALDTEMIKKQVKTN